MTELLADTGGTGLQQSSHQPGDVKAGVPQRLLQDTDGRQYCTFLSEDN